VVTPSQQFLSCLSYQVPVGVVVGVGVLVGVLVGVFVFVGVTVGVGLGEGIGSKAKLQVTAVQSTSPQLLVVARKSPMTAGSKVSVRPPGPGANPL
jgi:hypothetical protein